MSGGMMGARCADVIRFGVAVILGGIGAAAGFTHTHNWAAHHGQTGWLAWATAVVIEGIAIVAGFEIHHDRHTPRPNNSARRAGFPVVVLVCGVLVQMSAQVAEAEPTPAGWLLAAMPALGFLTVVKLLMRRLPTGVPQHVPVNPAPRSMTDTDQPVSLVDSSEGEPVSMPDDPGPPPQPLQPPHLVTRVKLPPEVTGRIHTAVLHARTEGRTPTIEDVHRVARIPEPLARQILADLTPEPAPGTAHN